MQILTKETLDAAIKKCQDSARYRVIIVTQYAQSHKNIIEYLNQFECDKFISLYEPYVKFSNGSVIRMISSSDSLMGRRASLVLCAEKYFNDKTSDKLRAIEIGSDSSFKR